MNLRQLKLLTCILLSTQLLMAQKMDKANELFRKGLYATAITEYQAVLKKKKNPLALSRLADCYRILNKAEESAKIYAQIIADNEAKDKDLFNYANVMMMRGKYDSAKYFFQKYIEYAPDDVRGLHSLKSCEHVKKLEPLYKYVLVEPYEFNSDADETAPVFFQNKLIFSSDRGQGMKVMKKANQTTGREFYAIWSSDKMDSTTYTEPVSYSGKLNNTNMNTGNVTITADGKELFFSRNSDEPDKGGTFNIQLFSAETSDGGKTWHNVEKIPFCANNINYLYPSVSRDGKQLFFVSDKGGGSGGLDLYVSNRTKKGWSKPQNLGMEVNTPAHESFPYAALDGKLYFCSKGHIGYGGFDIFVTEKDTATGEWKKPVNLGTPFNSAYDDISITFNDSISGAFTSPRSERGDDIFFFTILGQSLLASDNNLTFYNNQEELQSSTTTTEDAFLSNSVMALDILAYGLGDKKNLKSEKKFTLDNIVFEGKNTDISTTTAEELDKLADILSIHRKIVFEIGCHTEVDIDDAKAISQKRADAIMAYLIKKGIAAKRLMAKGYGFAQSLKDCRQVPCSKEEYHKNKRVEIKIKEVL